MEILAVDRKDAEELVAIYAPYVESTAISFEYEVPSVEEFVGRIDAISSRLPYLKAVEDGKIIGYAYAGVFKDRKAYDWSVETTVYVKEGEKRKGAGRALYEALEQILAKMGVLNLNACIAIPKSGEEDPYCTFDSMNFHERMGFSLVGTFHDSGYKYNRWYDMIWMEKMIGSHMAEQPDVIFGEWEKYLQI